MVARPHSGALIAVVAAAVLLVALLGAAQGHAAAYRTCALTENEQQPPGGIPTYTFTLKQQRTTCATARKVVTAFHRCRPKAAVQCARRLLAHWTCSGRKSSGTPVLFYATLTCRSGLRRVTSSYQQNT